ncbi:hypothetical protein Ait01nite_089900 [Actinoplanes italicus]|uniref:Uncharacterized protein n=1 Tax=Actinoplanes italicus TaxID=113567 RepID=A0A2T0JID9_9ACTN|nr:hypothetical protein [Actinoplanes italicus]PRX07407.1 hypothetical protein CLV67_14282 [Actinoplanes italicus]GIE35945.1 hypothetical protein Ait01nite_089900 [Actinoplanes italicus]
MTADLFRIIWTGRLSGKTVVSDPLPRDQALAEFDSHLGLRRAASNGLGRFRVMRDADYQQLAVQGGVYRGEAAKKPATVHHGDHVMATSCGLAQDEMPFLDNVSLLISRVTCLRCLNVLCAESVGRSR